MVLAYDFDLTSETAGVYYVEITDSERPEFLTTIRLYAQFFARCVTV